MNWNKDSILSVLDQCAEDFTFPVLDNGYVYLAATKLSAYRSNAEWSIVIEVFGFSPRSGEPDVQVYTFSSKLVNRNDASDYVSQEAYENYLKNNPYNESRFVHTIENTGWQNSDEPEYLDDGASCLLRGLDVSLPLPSEYQRQGIELEEDEPLTFEFCRYLAGKYRELVLCTEEERRVNLPPDMELVLQLDEWGHPDISGGELPSSTVTFQQLAEVLESGNAGLFKNSGEKNTHWKNWPEGGTL
jgi:hypothetical protein